MACTKNEVWKETHQELTIYPLGSGTEEMGCGRGHVWILPIVIDSSGDLKRKTNLMDAIDLSFQGWAGISMKRNS